MLIPKMFCLMGGGDSQLDYISIKVKTPKGLLLKVEWKHLAGQFGT